MQHEKVSPQHFRLSFITAGGIFFFPPEEIVRLEALSNYTCIHFRNHKPILMAKVLREYEALLQPYGFIRTHRSHLVNRTCIARIDSGGNIIMNDQSRAEISRRKKRQVLESLFNRLSTAA